MKLYLSAMALAVTSSALLVSACLFSEPARRVIPSAIHLFN